MLGDRAGPTSTYIHLASRDAIASTVVRVSVPTHTRSSVGTHPSQCADRILVTLDAKLSLISLTAQVHIDKRSVG